MGQFITKLENMNSSILKLIIKIFKICLCICALSIILLIYYKCIYTYHVIYESALLLFKTGLLISVFAFICGFVIDSIRQ